MILGAYNKFHEGLDATRAIDGIGPLLLRLYLAPIFWMAGIKKLENFDSTVTWFGNANWGLGLPFPELLAFLATWTEIFGAVFLVLGFALRWISIPLIVTMIVAIFTVHIDNGWLAIAEPQGFFANERTAEAVNRLGIAKDILREHGNYNWLTGQGSLVILNNGIEFAATYTIMLISLFFTGAGKFFSVDYWLNRKVRAETKVYTASTINN